MVPAPCARSSRATERDEKGMHISTLGTLWYFFIAYLLLFAFTPFRVKQLEIGNILKENAAVCCETEEEANIMFGVGGPAHGTRGAGTKGNIRRQNTVSPIDVKLEGEGNVVM